MMRAVIVAVLPDLPVDDDTACARAFTAAAEALGRAEPKPVQVIAAVRETADAVIAAAGATPAERPGRPEPPFPAGT